MPSSSPAAIALPSPVLAGAVSLEEALSRRRSVREFTTEPLADAQLGQLLWAAHGVTDPSGRRTAPSAGFTDPLELSVVTPDGIYRYAGADHALAPLANGDLRPQLSAAANGQAVVAEAAAIFVISAVLERTIARYGDNARRFIDLEAGHVAENVLLQAVTLGLGGVPAAAFDAAAVHDVLGLPADETVIYLVAVGRPRTG